MQLYLPGERENERDAIFEPTLVLRMSRTVNGHAGEFEFVVEGRSYSPSTLSARLTLCRSQSAYSASLRAGPSP